MHPDGDRTLDELLAAAAPVTDRDLDRPEVRAAARAVIEELPMPSHPTAPPATAGDRPPLDTGHAGGADAGAPHDLVVGTPAREPRRRRGRMTVAAAAAALALALVSAAVVRGGDDGGEPTATGSVAAPGQSEEVPDTPCGWATSWLDADLRGDQEGRDRAVAGLAEFAAAHAEADDPYEAAAAEAYRAAMSAGDRLWVEAWHRKNCGP
ncbi:MAG: hypothetical protein JXA83_06840 [Acidimicrobiales bacterium]|nr:hypothetical protein [Acidimicrobiales bacterium]